MSQRKQKQKLNSKVSSYPQKQQKKPMNKKLFIGMRKKKCQTKKWFPKNRRLMTKVNQKQNQLPQTYFKLRNHFYFQINRFIYNDAIDDYVITQWISEIIQNILPDLIMFYTIIGLLVVIAIAKYAYLKE